MIGIADCCSCCLYRRICGSFGLAVFSRIINHEDDKQNPYAAALRSGFGNHRQTTTFGTMRVSFCNLTNARPVHVIVNHRGVYWCVCACVYVCLYVAEVLRENYPKKIGLLRVGHSTSYFEYALV